MALYNSPKVTFSVENDPAYRGRTPEVDYSVSTASVLTRPSCLKEK